jgi:hypothetical protein
MRQGWVSKSHNARRLSRLLGETGVVVVMVVTVVDYHHDLRLRRIGHCEAEDENQS